MKLHLLATLAVAVLAACGGTTGSTTTTTPAAGPTCDAAADNTAVQLRAQLGDRLDADKQARVRATIFESCTADAWSSDAIECVAEADADQIEACDRHLPDDVMERLGGRMRAILDEIDDDGLPEPPTDDY
jgi:hypothetical protein